MNKLLTIVVPVYKVEQYINKCLDSCVLEDEKLMSQLEVIIVNDGTPDNSAEMSREYVKRYPQTFHQIDKENGGHGSACNVGLKEATGKYVRFLDSDDWLSNLDLLLETLSKTDVDLVFTHTLDCHVDGRKDLHQVIGEYDKEKIIDEFPFEDNPIWITGLSYCTYKTSLLKKKKPLFIEKYFYDDTILFVAPLTTAKSYIIKDCILYNYLIGRPGQSVSADVSKRQTRALWKTHEYCSQYWENNASLCLYPRVKEFINRYMSERAAHILSLSLLSLPYNECQEAYSRCYRQITNPKGKTYNRFIKYPFCMFWMIESIRNTAIYKQLASIKH